MTLVITPGETSLIKELEKLNVEVARENLLIGDIHIRGSNGETLYIFERKAKGDLNASIIDGRYHEQKSRLLQSNVPRKNIIYIIENLTNADKKVWSAICNTQHRDGMGVFQTTNTAETAVYLTSMTESVKKFKPIDDSIAADDEKVYVNIKKREINGENWFKYALSLIPKCSLNIAELITEKYPNFSSLIDEINENGDGCLANIKNGEKKLGKKLSAEICGILAAFS